MGPEIKAALGQVDWLRAVHRLSTLGREIRGDADGLETDHETERARGVSLTRSARKIMDCQAPRECDCAMCEG